MKRCNIVLWASLVVLLGWAVGCAPIGEPDQPGNVGEQIGDPKKAAIKVPEALKDRVKAALDQVKNRELLTSHAFWTVFHGILGNGLGTTLLDPFTKQEVNAVDYIRKGGPMSGLEFHVYEGIDNGKDGVDVRIGPTFYGQGHQDQFVAEMAQLGLPRDTVFYIKYKGKVREYPFADFIRYSKYNTIVKADQELSWTILVVSQYEGTQVNWINRHGDKINFEDVVRYETDQPIENAACGGTHRLFGLTWAYYIHRRDGGKMTPVWQALDAHLKKYRDNAFDNRNKVDGSFSTEYFRGPGNNRELDRRIGATGHIVEWLALYLSDEELRSDWMQAAVNSLVLMVLDGHDRLIDGGSIYHAAHGLHLYYWRVWGADDALPSSKVIPLPPKK